MQQKLKQLYQRQFDSWKSSKVLVANESKLSAPFLSSIPEPYANSKLKLVIIGQQTDSWGTERGKKRANWVKVDSTEAVDELTKEHSSYYQNPVARRRPFFKAANSIAKQLGFMPRSWVWANLSLFDINGQAPRDEVRQAVGGSNLLRKILEILQPDAVVLFTNHRNDEYLCDGTLPETTAIGDLPPKVAARIILPGFPAKTFRTSHPRWLIRGRWHVLTVISEQIAISA
jgi:hypothetical protein